MLMIFRVRVYDTRTSNPVASFTGHMYQITTVQMDDWKVISGGYDGFVFVWDLRMTRKLWEIHNRYKNICCVSLNLGKKKKMNMGLKVENINDLLMFYVDSSFRHPVRHCRFSEEKLVFGNVPCTKFPVLDEFENSTHRR